MTAKKNHPRDQSSSENVQKPKFTRHSSSVSSSTDFDHRQRGIDFGTLEFPENYSFSRMIRRRRTETLFLMVLIAGPLFDRKNLESPDLCSDPWNKRRKERNRSDYKTEAEPCSYLQSPSRRSLVELIAFKYLRDRKIDWQVVQSRLLPFSRGCLEYIRPRWYCRGHST